MTLPEVLDNITLGPGLIDYGHIKISFDRLSLRRDELPAELIATNGSGKTSLMLALSGGLMDIAAATVDIQGFLNTTSRTYHWGQALLPISFVPQRWEHGLLGYSVPLEFALTAASVDWAEHIKQTLSLNALSTQPIETLSDGEKKRLSAGLALSQANPLLISDELSTHLDDHWWDAVQLLLGDYADHMQGSHLALSSGDGRYSGASVLNDFLVTSGHSLSTAEMPATTYLEDFKAILSDAVQQPVNRSSVDIYVSRRPVLEDSICISGRGGDHIEITGPNGSGKTSLLRAFWQALRRGRTGSQMFLLLADPTYQILGPTVGDELGRVLHGLASDQNRVRDSIVSFLNLTLDRDVLTLSFGQRKTIASIEAVLSGVPILAWDEPYAGLDSKNRAVIRALVEIARESGRFVLTATHSRHWNAAGVQHIELYATR